MNDSEPLMFNRGLTCGNRSIQSEERSQPCFPHRYRLLFLSFFAYFNTFTMRVNFNIALVSMVNYTKEDHWNASDECPGHLPSINSTTNTENGPFDWSPEIQALLLGSYYYGYPLLQLLAGYLAERYGAKLLIGLSQLIPALLTLLTPHVAHWNVYVLIALRACMGLCAGPTYPSFYVLWSRWAPWYEQTQMIAISSSGASVGNVVALAVSGLLCQSDFIGGWPSVFYVFGGVSVVWFIFWMIFVYDTPATHPHISTAEKLYIEAGNHNLDTVKYTNPPLRKLLTSVPFLSLLFVMITDSLGYYTILNSTPTYMKQILKFDIKENGLLTSVPHLVSFLPGIFIGVLADYIRRKQILSNTATRKLFTLIGEIGMASCMVGLALLDCDRIAAIVFLTLSMTTESISTGGFVVNHMDLAPMYAGTLMGISNALANTGGFVSPVLTTKITQNSPSRSDWRKVFLMNAGILTLGALVYLCFASGEEQSWAKEKRIAGMPTVEEEDGPLEENNASIQS